MNDPSVRDKLARILTRPMSEWPRRVEAAFPNDPKLRGQALLWLHSEKRGTSMDNDAPSLGEAADARYELGLRLDTGSTSTVWQAMDRRLGRSVAIKVFHEHSETDGIDQVLAEARAASEVVSEHVVRVLDVQYGDGHPYIVMDLISEYSPEDREVVLGASASAVRTRDCDEIASWVAQIARGVHDAHLRNVFHRDLKPKNVLITPRSRRAYVADFGLAVSGANPDAKHPAITLLKRGPSGPLSVRGTPEFMAPEQARGLPLSLDARSAEDRGVLVAIDVWGLGAIAYDLLAGRPPWPGRGADDLSAWEVAASTERPPPLERTSWGERVPHRLRRVIEKAMATDPAQRYGSAAALAHELETYLEHRPTTLDRSPWVRFALWVRRNPQLAAAAVLALALFGAVVIARAALHDLRDQRDALDREVAAQRQQHDELDASVRRASADLQSTRSKLAKERADLDALQRSVADERVSYQSLIDAKEEALRNATKATRQLVEQLDTARKDNRTIDEARALAQQGLRDARKRLDSAVKEREQMRRERDTTRSERDQVRRERDSAIADRDASERKLREVELKLERATAARAAPGHAGSGSSSRTAPAAPVNTPSPRPSSGT